VGNLRPPESIRSVTPEPLGAHIKKLSNHGISFNYVLNSELLPTAITEEYRDEVIEFLQNLHDIGVRAATVTIPWLITLIRLHFPDIHVRVSIVNEVSTVRESLEYEELGATGIVLDRDINRDIALLKDIRKQFKGEIELLCNSACVFHCINVHYHGIYSSAVTNSMIQKKYGTKSALMSTPYCNFYCRRRFFENPNELIKIHWIRPEDLKKYAELGMNLFKIDGRDKEPRYIKAVIKAYLEGHYDGNLFHLLQPEFCEDVKQIGNVDCDPDNATEAQLEEWTGEFLSESADWHVGIDNRDLDGFSDAFFSGKINCKGNCASCRYCEKFARQVVIDPTWQRKIVKVMKYNLEKYYGKKL
jgi:collagenase-like PrtC family protease